MSVVVDTSALFALLDSRDENFSRAAKQWELMPEVDLVTHAYVVSETIAVLRSRLGWSGVDALVDRFLPSLRVEMVDRALHDQALAAYQAQHGGKSFVDHVTIAFARRDGIQQAFAYDRDLTTAGLTLIG